MDAIEEQIKRTVGRAAFWALLKIVRSIEISIDGDDKQITIYRDNSESVKISFEQIERFINDTH